MSRKLIIDGNAVYELDEECMLKRRVDQPDKRNTQDYSQERNRAVYEQRRKNYEE